MLGGVAWPRSAARAETGDRRCEDGFAWPLQGLVWSLLPTAVASVRLQNSERAINAHVLAVRALRRQRVRVRMELICMPPFGF